MEFRWKPNRAGAQVRRTSRHWARKADAAQQDPHTLAATSWLDSPLVLERHVQPAISGRPDVGWFQWVMENYVPADATAACNLGRGGGGLERHARYLGFDARFDSFDISEGSLEIARKEAQRLGLARIEYRQADLNECPLPEATYQVVFASMSLHHVSNLEGLLRSIRAALEPGGLLVFNEFVGPRKFQWTDVQLELINVAMDLLPERLRVDLAHRGRLKDRVRRPTLEEMDVIDPSEAALSDRIIPLADEIFEPVVRRDYGGTITHMLLDRIIGNFDPDREEDMRALDAIFRLETLCLETGQLPSDFAVAVYRKSDPAS